VAEVKRRNAAAKVAIIIAVVLLLVLVAGLLNYFAFDIELERPGEQRGRPAEETDD
jgi:hypothetical protein